MTTKIISLSVLATMLLLLVYGAIAPNDPLFLLISNDPMVVFIRLVLSVTAVALAFRGRFTYKEEFSASTLVGFGLIGFAITGIVSGTVAYGLMTYIKPFDYIFMITVGIFYLLAAATLKPSRRRLHLRKTVIKHAPEQLAVRLSHS